MKLTSIGTQFKRSYKVFFLLPLFLAASHAVAEGVSEKMLTGAQEEANNWRMVGRDYMSTRFSPLKQVNTKSVKRMVPKWTFSFGVLDEQNTTPLIHNGIMYVTASHGRTFAVNALRHPGMKFDDRQIADHRRANC